MGFDLRTILGRQCLIEVVREEAPDSVAADVISGVHGVLPTFRRSCCYPFWCLQGAIHFGLAVAGRCVTGRSDDSASLPSWSGVAQALLAPSSRVATSQLPAVADDRMDVNQHQAAAPGEEADRSVLAGLELATVLHQFTRMADDPLFSPLRLGDLVLPNRVVMTPIKLGYGTERGDVTRRHVAFHALRAQGGTGLITTEPLYVQPNGRELSTQLGAHADWLIGGLRWLVDAVHAAGGRIMAHITHAGRAANPKLISTGDLLSASPVLCGANGVTPRALTGREIAHVVAAFGEAAGRVGEAGFDALEVPFSHGYLIHQFLSPYSNRRQDEYGGSLENRLRFGKEVIAAVRKELGPGLPIVVRMNAEDYVGGGLTIEDAEPIAKALEEMGVSALSITSGTMCESVPFCLYPSGTPEANLLPMAARIRHAVLLPVIVAGRIRTPSVARRALAAGQADLIGLGRPFLADPAWVRKTAAGDEDSILLCAACHQGCLAELRKGHGTSCVFNPLTGREAEVLLSPAAKPRNVMVVGGGPAGLEAASVAAERRHHVVLFEKESRLGGQLRLAARPPYKQGFLDVIRYQELTARRAGVEIHLNTKITPERVAATRPEVLIVATGGIPLSAHFPGLDQTTWLLASELLNGGRQVETPDALVIGGGLVGLETADFLAAQGKQVTVVEMLDDVGVDMDSLAKTMLTKRLKEQGVVIRTGTRIVRFADGAAIARTGNHETEFPFGTVVMAVGMRASRELADALASEDLEIHVIGDAAEPRRALEAVYEGFDIGRKL
jgi:2,4-dienoyl-CoA reductase-like NADH-dependent reductase (Old Yellow Enzyme family)/thioredoxin reductase